jgi:hypothetical protein
MAYDASQKTSLRKGYDATGMMTRKYMKNTGGGASMPMTQVSAPVVAPPVATPLRDEASAARERLRMQIANEQQGLLAGRRAGTIARGGETDATSLANIARLRQEMAGYDRAANPVQRPNTPQQNLNANRSVAGQAAGIMSRDLSAMEQRVYTMPPGPMRDAEVEKIRVFKSRLGEQVNAAGVLDPNEVGPSTPGFADAMATAEGQTANQVAGAARNYDRRQNELAFAKEQTAKRMAEEQRTRDVKDATFNAGMAGIRRPEDEFNLRREATNAEIRAREAAAAKAEQEATRTGLLTDEQIASEKYKRDPMNPLNREASAKADVLTAEANKYKNQIGQPGFKTKEEMETAVVGREFASQQAGLTKQLEDNAMQAASALASEIGGPRGDTYQGSLWTGDAAGGLKATSQLISFAQTLEDLAQTDPQAARNKARDFLANMPRKLSGTSESLASAASRATGLVGGIVGTPFTFGLSLLATAGAAAQQGAQMLNARDKARVVNDINRTREILERLSR